MHTVIGPRPHVVAAEGNLSVYVNEAEGSHSFVLIPALAGSIWQSYSWCRAVMPKSFEL